MMNYGTLNGGKLTARGTMSGGALSARASFTGGALTVPAEAGGIAYDGEADITPSAVEQRLETAGRMMREDIVIQPIPRNYGLITWNGTTITVS